jgi:NAD+ synthetase
MPVLDCQRLIEDRVASLQRYHESSNLARAELDVSGGIDSAVLLMLLARALGPENVTAVYSSIDSSEGSRLRARAVAAATGVKLIALDLSRVVQDTVIEIARAVEEAGLDLNQISSRETADKTIAGSFRSCFRAPVGRYLNRLTGGGIRHGTGNEDEDRWLRFYQKGGDGEVDTNPLAMLSKGEVYQLAVALGVPREIIVALPSPDLWGCGDQHNDEDELLKLSGVDWTYSRVDPDSGQYVKVGTIERLSRFLDHEFFAWFDGHCRINGGWLFAKDSGHEDSGDWSFNLDALVEQARPFFPGESGAFVRRRLESARKWERSTRHKLNPNCPQLGSRRELLDALILTDALPEV